MGTTLHVTVYYVFTTNRAGTAATLLAAVQGVRIRILNNEIDASALNPEMLAMIDDVASFFDLPGRRSPNR
ncbi:hypothetical protein ACOBV8_19830 (plasmid) [Pseudoalteromonas espejiana]